MVTFPGSGQKPYGTLLKTYIDYGAVNVFRATGSDDTAAINTFLAASTPLGVKKLVGAFTVSATLAVQANTYVDASAATITTSIGTSGKTITMAAGSTWVGGTIVSPGSWDGTNTGTWDSAVIWVQGDGCTVNGVTLTNVPRAGIVAVDVNDVQITDNRIVGNYPAAQWTGVETQHFAIAYDAPSGAPHGDVVISGNIVRSCVQGFQSGGTGTITASGVSISGNTFQGCWNHAVYGYGYGFSVVGNAVNRCGIPIALWGQYHSVVGNTLYTDTTGGSDARDSTGISMRDPFGCIVKGNTIRGNGGSGAVLINLTQNSGTDVSNNIVEGNTLDITGQGIAIRVGQGATTCRNNKVKGNIVNGQGTSGQGLITLTSTGSSYRNDIEGNTVVMQGTTHGIYVSNSVTARVAGNTVALEYNAGSAVTLACVAIATDATGVNIIGNQFECPSTFGTNVTFRGIYEISGGPGVNRLTNNSYTGMNATLATVQPLTLSGTAASYVDEVGTGVPSFMKAQIGSLWRRTDGGAGTSLYVNQTGLSSGWVGK